MTKMLAVPATISGTMESMRVEMKADANEAVCNLNSKKTDTSVQTLKDEIDKEGLQRKKEHDALETRIEAHIESGRRKFRMNSHL